MTEGWRGHAMTALGVAVCLFTLAEVNYPLLTPQGRLAIFAMLGLVLCFLKNPVHRSLADNKIAAAGDVVLALAAIAACGYVVVQSEPAFESFWIGGAALGNRAGQETGLDTAVGVLGLFLVLEATRRTIGLALPLLSLTFLAYAYFGSGLPDWLFPHRGYGVDRIVAQTFLHSQGVFGTALRVMFVYVFLFVLFGAFLKATGATQFIIDLARRTFGKTPGGPAKVSVMSSGLMGSLSGSAVANTATTGTFTIPMMRSAGFKPEIAAGVEAAASSGGALVPPVMGAAAYMMLEIIDPPVTYLQIIRAALLPALLYYFSLLMIVHLYAKRIGIVAAEGDDEAGEGVWKFEGIVFVTGFAALLGALFFGYTVFRAATLALLVVLIVSAIRPTTRISWSAGLKALRNSALDGIALVAAAACVGIIIGVVTLTGIGTKLPATILGLSQGNVLAALVLIMVSSIVLGMGLPSAVCYLLMATLIGPVLSELGVVTLGAHLFIFYFGMMSMVTPPVALAAYAASSIAGSRIMPTGFAAFRFALVGFTLPYMFVLRPQLMMLDSEGAPSAVGPIVAAMTIAVLGIVPLAAAISGYLFAPLGPAMRAVLMVSAGLLLLPTDRFSIPGVDLPVFAVVGFVLLIAVGVVNRSSR
jgi:TRAP transporter 4TM/12TM fusion protein